MDRIIYARGSIITQFVNLTPYKPSDWSDKIVVSKTTGTYIDSSPLYTTDTLYIDWAVINNGTGAITNTFNFKLYVDGVERGSWSIAGLNANVSAVTTDYSIGTLSAGSHSIKIVADVTGAVQESNESDNEYTKTITVDNICTYSISPTSQSFGSSGGTGSVAVTTTSGCSWTAVSSASWVTITSGSSGTGNGTVAYSVSANTGTSSRTGTMTIAGQTFTVTQGGISCTYSISPTSQSFGSSGGTGSVAVTTSSGCSWTAASNAIWITVTSGSSGTGNGTVAYSVSTNTGTSQRTGTMAIAGQTFTVTQEGVSCTYSISPTSQSFGSSGGTGSVGVTATSSSCSWTAVSNATWITVTSGSSGTGNGTVAYSVSANTSTNPRTGTMNIGKRVFIVRQDGACAYSLSPTSKSFSFSGGTSSVTVCASSSSCSWTAVSNATWITVTSGGSGTGNRRVIYSVSANTGTSARTGTMTIAGKTFTVTQGGKR